MAQIDVPMDERAGQEITPADELRALRTQHKEMLARHTELNHELRSALQADCKRLHTESEEMETSLRMLRRNAPRSSPTDIEAFMMNRHQER
jgi:hypothetical protein